MARLLIRKIQATHRERRTPLISLELLDDNDILLQSFRDVTPDPGAEVTVGGLDFLSALCLTESDLASSSFDLVMADKSAPLLSIGQRDVHVRYGSQSAIITVVICPEITSVLLSWLDCIALHILHKDYPLPIQQMRTPTSIKTLQTHLLAVDTSFLAGLVIPPRPSNEQIATIKAAIVGHFHDVFDQSSGLRCMNGPDMTIHLADNAVPYYVSGARPIAYADRPAVKQQLDD